MGIRSHSIVCSCVRVEFGANEISNKFHLQMAQNTKVIPTHAYAVGRDVTEFRRSLVYLAQLPIGSHLAGLGTN